MEHIIYQLDKDLAILTLNRPEVANGFHIPMCEEILEVLTLAEEDSSVHFILINANGKVFSVGGDLVEMKRAVDEDDIPSLTKIAELVNTISYKIKQIGKPILMELLQVPQRIWLLLQISVLQRIKLSLSKPLLGLVWLLMRVGFTS